MEKNTNKFCYIIIYRKSRDRKGKAIGLSVIMMNASEFESFEQMSEAKQNDTLREYNRTNDIGHFGKVSLKHIKGESGSAYKVEYTDDMKSIYPSTAIFIARFNLPCIRVWAEMDRSEEMGYKARMSADKESKKSLRNDMTLEEMKRVYQGLSAYGRAAFAVALQKELTEFKW